MTEEIIKELLSRRYLELVAGRSGYARSSPENDFGVDVEFRPVIRYEQPNGDLRSTFSEKRIDIQLKCTCERGVLRDRGTIKYDLEAKTYNDLVFRNQPDAIIPLILVLVILPDDVTQWLNLSTSELVFRRCGYWYQHPVGTVMTGNPTRKRIVIPEENAITVDFFPQRFVDFFGTAA